ncbi:NADH-quinone oxidoreductase subunit L [Streptomyces sp. H10-C2]|uniref:NADH-quinone oxidoreductase subunit 5 family protein n=1 Tax=unclassified Streptomyces TaxID=2593676 RepID=UPI0024B8F6BC|nr:MULTISPECIES: NADH-quinone oxidoreductase subunit L [unclassified Streptomyces]MDJ0346284.1 NADH-quinone oxidoreductase subunit L [Streptomyces sp. PH10-H1]MDJ0375272.1 NADH-quinone oxidoreductase subunit L [Streptomyces sp. H10-C2]
MTLTTLAALVPLLPFLGAAAGLLLGRRAPGFVRPLAVLPTVAAFALAAVVAVRQGSGAPTDAATRLTPTGSIPIDVALHLDGFAVLIAVLVGLVATCVQLYSTAYLRDDPRYPSYAALVSLFTAAMFLVVYSGDLMVLLVGWEIMGICSYFLVGHYWETEVARAASMKAFLVTKLGDVPFIIGVFALATDAGTFRINGILTAATHGELQHPTLIALLLLAGVAGKSAQFPLHTWLPDAMAGPTPVSALIHAATMVAAGIYFVARLLPVFTSSAAALAVLAVMAAVTMIGSGLAALAQDDIKRVLAYSTIGQLGYMAGALAVGDRSAAVFHLLSHGAFKALLFLGAGVVIHAAGTNSLAAMSRMGDLGKRAPDAMWTMGIALAALAALPPFSGFFSKESVLRAAEHASGGHAAGVPSAVGWIVLAAGLITAVLTAGYATRLFLLAFRGRGPVSADHGREPAVMNTVLWVLAVPSVAFGMIALVPKVFDLPKWFDGTELTPTLLTSVLSVGLALVGILVTYGAWTAGAARRTAPLGAAVVPSAETEPALVEEAAIATHKLVFGDIAAADDPADPGRLLLGPLHRHAASGFHLDALYTALFVRPVLAAASLVHFLDREVVETYVRGAGAAPRLLGAAVRRAQTGNVQTYLSALLAGAVVLAVLVAVGA